MQKLSKQWVIQTLIFKSLWGGFQVSLNAWFWSTVFHTRDTYLTEVRAFKPLVTYYPKKKVDLCVSYWDLPPLSPILFHLFVFSQLVFCQKHCLNSVLQFYMQSHDLVLIIINKSFTLMYTERGKLLMYISTCQTTYWDEHSALWLVNELSKWATS